MKKLISLLLALMMVFSLAITAFATTTDPETPPQQPTAGQTGSITINGVSEGPTYSIYRLLDLESYTTEGKGAYSYTINPAWSGFFTAGTGALDYVVIKDGYVTWNKDKQSDADIVKFSQLALKYAQDESHPISPVEISNTSNNWEITGNSGVFSGLELGYYLVDSTVGALCGLTTTNPNASINAKNGQPTIDKQVQEDSTLQYGSTNTADIGQLVEFRTTINVHAGAQNYVLHDTMDTGLTFVQDKDNKRGVYEIRHIVPGTPIENEHEKVGTVVPAEYYSVVTTDLDDDCTFEIIFTDAFHEHIEINDKIVVYYNAMLNRDAVVGSTAESEEGTDGNQNSSKLTFGEGMETTEDTTKTYTFGIDIVKTDSQNTLLDGAVFRIYDAPTAGNIVYVVPLMQADETTNVLDSNGKPMYRRARPDEAGTANCVDITVSGGQVTIVGFDNGIYYLQEIEAPTGYNKLTERQKFIISDANLPAVYNEVNGEKIFSTGSGVHVVNNTGTMLPETGAKGTAAFITFGVVVMLATGCLLVTRKRLSMIED